MILDKVTFCVSTCGNIKALLMCLSSVLNGTRLPSLIMIRFEGETGGFAEFYLEQLAALARFKGVEWWMHDSKPRGIRHARDFFLDNCPTDFLWMCDDDVIYEPDCLEHLWEYVGCSRLGAMNENLSYVCGTKGDLNNRRGYGNFKMDVHGKDDVYENCPFNWFYDKKECAGLSAPIFTMDTGNALIYLPNIRAEAIRFGQFAQSTNSGGEDTIFALECRHRGLEAFIIPSARSYHLEKPNINFSEFAARAEMVLRVCELRKYKQSDVDYMKRVFFPWLQLGTKSVREKQK